MPLTRLLLGLRNHGHQVGIVQPNGAPRPVLGTAQPGEERRRAAVLAAWGIDPDTARQPVAATIDQPLAQRTQTILAYRLAPEQRRRLDPGGGQAGNAPRRPGPARPATAALDPHAGEE